MRILSCLNLRSRIQGCFLRPRLRKVRLLVCDVDGVLTDGGLYYDEDGLVVKRFDVHDGLAVRMLQRVGIIVVLLSGGRGGAVEHRARHLGITYCYTGVVDKHVCLRRLQDELGMSREATAFIGDDLNDLVVRSACGVLVAPADAAQGLRQQADWLLSRPGGYGALREFTEVLLASQGQLKNLQRFGWREVNG